MKLQLNPGRSKSSVQTDSDTSRRRDTHETEGHVSHAPLGPSSYDIARTLVDSLARAKRGPAGGRVSGWLIPVRAR